MRKRWLCVAAALAAVGLFHGCKTAVDPSPEPGILRVLLKGADTDTTIIIQNDTSQFSRWDNFNVYVSQGRLYRGDNYAYTYNNVSSERKSSDTVNILGRERLNGVPITFADSDPITPANSRFRTYIVFESYVPPGTYDRLTMTITAKPTGTPNSPAEIGWMPHHSSTGEVTPKMPRSQGCVVAM